MYASGSPENFGLLIAASFVVLLTVPTWRHRAGERHGGILTIFFLAVAEVLRMYACTFSSALKFKRQDGPTRRSPRVQAVELYTQVFGVVQA